MDLRITTNQGLIGMNITQVKMDINYGKSNFRMQTKNPKTNMETTQPKVNIDQSKPLAEIGLNGNFDLMKINVNKSKQKALNGISKIAKQGDELAEIQLGNNAISSQAKYNAFDQHKKEVNIDFIPKSRPKVDLQEGKVKIDVEKGDVDIQNKPQEVSLNYDMGKVEVYLRQKPYIDVEYIGSNLDFRI